MPPASLRFGTPQESMSFARERDARVCRLLESHPVTAAMLVGLRWFPTKTKALKRLRRLVKRQLIRLVGTVCRKAGRPEHVYCRYRPKADSLLHEVELTELCLRLAAGRIDRGPQAVDRTLRPDAELWINGQPYFLELDRGTMGYAQIQRRFRVYEATRDFALWVCSTPDRRDDFRARAEGIRHVALFTTIADALRDPHEPIWIDYAGGRTSLPRDGAGKEVSRRHRMAT